MNTRDKMRRSNRKARKFLAKQFPLVHINPHMMWDTCDMIDGKETYNKDDFGFFDGYVIDNLGQTVYIQIKTNSCSDFNKFKKFCNERKLRGMFIKITDRKKTPETRLS